MNVGTMKKKHIGHAVLKLKSFFKQLDKPVLINLNLTHTPSSGAPLLKGQFICSAVLTLESNSPPVNHQQQQTHVMGKAKTQDKPESVDIVHTNQSEFSSIPLRKQGSKSNLRVQISTSTPVPGPSSSASESEKEELDSPVKYDEDFIHQN
jgi:hypothetical protein